MIKFNGVEISRKYFCDGTFNLTHLPHIEPLNPSLLEWRYDCEEELVLLIYFVNYIRDKWLTIKDINLILPYVPNARMDRTKNPEKEIHTLKYFCRIINSLNFTTVYILDPHSDVTETLLNHVILLDVESTIIEAIETSGASFIYFPDRGSMKRYRTPTSPLRTIRPYLYGEKERDWETRVIQSTKIVNPLNLSPEATKDKTVLMIDDICSSGSTFLWGAKALQEAGFNFGAIDVYATHCENTVFSGKLLKEDSPIRNIYTTDTLARNDHDKIRVFGLEF